MDLREEILRHALPRAGQKPHLGHQIALLAEGEVADLRGKAEMLCGDGQIGDGAAHAHVEGAVAGIDKGQTSAQIGEDGNRALANGKFPGLGVGAGRS